MKHYLFVHFRQSTTPEGEQVHFALSRDGFHWDALNGGNPVLWAYQGDHGVRDMTIVRSRFDGTFHIFATDLSLSIGMRGKYNHSWKNASSHGSKALAHWVSSDLVHWSEEALLPMGDDDFGCLWAPDVIFDPEHDDYVLHWSSTRQENDFSSHAIYCSRTKDFVHFSPPRLLYCKDDSTVIDSAMYEENGVFYLFVKSGANPNGLILLQGKHVQGPFTRVNGFDQAMLHVDGSKLEAPTVIHLDDGRWCLFLDYYGVPGKGQGYVPFIAPSLASGAFVRSDASFSFPYGFKHGTILEITPEEYDRMLNRDWTDVPDNRFYL